MGAGGGGRSGREEKFQPSAPDIGLAWILGLGRFKTVRAKGRGRGERVIRAGKGKQKVGLGQEQLVLPKGKSWRTAPPLVNFGGGEELTPEAYRLGAGECYSIYLSICISVYPNNLSIYLNNSVSLCLPGLHSTCRVQTCSVENIVERRHVR